MIVMSWLETAEVNRRETPNMETGAESDRTGEAPHEEHAAVSGTTTLSFIYI